MSKKEIEIVKVIQSRMSRRQGKINLFDYVDHYGLTKSQIEQLLSKEGLLKQLGKYNNEY